MPASDLFLAVGAAFLSTLALTGAMRQYAIKGNLFDIPNERSSHAIPTPRGGGFSFVVVFLCSAAFLNFKDYITSELFLTLFIGGGATATIGFIDDHHSVHPKWRILIHVTAAVWAVLLFGIFPMSGVFSWLQTFIWLFLLVWLINLYNFMDGIDGIAGLETIGVAASGALLFHLKGNPELAILLILLAVGNIGFLVWNWPPAKIFMGDVGSGFLGFVLGAIALYSTVKGILSVWPWLILLAVFWVDASITLLRRIMNGEKWHRPHRSHAYQHAAKHFRSHAKVSSAVFAINLLWLLPLAGLASHHPKLGCYLTFIAALPLIALALKFKAGISETNGN